MVTLEKTTRQFFLEPDELIEDRKERLSNSYSLIEETEQLYKQIVNVKVYDCLEGHLHFEYEGALNQDTEDSLEEHLIVQQAPEYLKPYIAKYLSEFFGIE